MEQAVILGCGYVGQAVARLWQNSLQVTATTTTPDRVAELAPIAQQVVVLQGNDRAGLASLLQGKSLVLVSVGAPRADAYEATYLQTAKTLEQVVAATPSVSQIIYTGSYAVYGDRQGAWVDETSALAPANRNGEILAETEQILLRLATPARRVCLFRLGGIYGPDRELVKIFRRAAGTTRPGNGQDAANWIHLEDIVGAIDFARQRQLSGIYNLVGNPPTTTGELLQQVLTAHGLPPVTWDATQSSNRPYNARVSNQKLRQAGYQFRYPDVVTQ